MNAPQTTETVTPAGEMKPEITTPPAVVEPAHRDAEDVLADLSPDIDVEGTIVPVEGDAPAAIVDPAVGAGAGGEPAGEVAPIDEEIVVEPPVQREDGKWMHGKYVGDTLEELFVQVEKGRRNAEKLVGKKAEAPSTDNPFLLNEEEGDPEFGDEEYVFDEAELGSVFGAGIAQALVQNGLVPQQQPVDHGAAVAQTMTYAQQVVQSPHSSDDDFRGVLQALVLNSPDDARSRQVVLEEWGARNPVAAAQEASRIEWAFQQVAQEQRSAAEHAFQQEQVQAQQAQQAGVEQATAAEHEAFEVARTAFEERNPTWTQHAPAMWEFMGQRAAALAKAKGDPAAIYDEFSTALRFAVATSPAAAAAGIGHGVSEQGSNMGHVAHTQQVDPAATARAHVAEMRDLASLETGAAIDDVNVTLRNPNPPGLAETPLADVIGMPMVS